MFMEIMQWTNLLWTSVHDEEWSRRPLLVNNRRKQKLKVKFRKTGVSLSFQQITRYLLHEVIIEHVGYKKSVLDGA